MNGGERVLGEISYGVPSDQWKQYDVFKVPILENGKATRFCGIVHKGQLKSIVTNDYVLFPNEEALRLAGEAAKVVGLEPFNIPHPISGRHGHALYNYKETRMHAIFMPKGVNKVDGDEVHVGVDVRNGIDGLSSFGCSVFSFRGVCSNGAIYGYKQIYGITAVHIGQFQEVITRLTTVMTNIMDKSTDVLESYRRMARQQLTEKLIEKIKKSGLPKKVLPDYVTEPSLEPINVWQTYNDITEAIWHGKSDLPTKVTNFDALHRALPLVVKK